MSDDSDLQLDDGFDDKHAEIVEKVRGLNKWQHLKKTSEALITLQSSDSNLAITEQEESIQDVEHFGKVQKTKKNTAEIYKKFESFKKKTQKRKTHTIPKPLEKPQTERIRRSVGYEKSRYTFDRWEAFVTSSRAQEHQVFPLDSVENLKVEAKEAAKFPSTWTFKSELQKELETLDPDGEEYHIEDEDEKDDLPKTLQELKENRKEAAKLRAHQSFKEAKARKQNKIKSKKYHRILRKEKIKQKLKEFEELQLTNPEEALKKLEEIEKARALERFSLRHKGTGQWAKSKQIRAKYDKESRQVLAQQLQISRDLTQKQKHIVSDSEDEGFEEGKYASIPIAENPWVGGPKPDEDVTGFVTDYKKFWTEQNKQAEVKQTGDVGEVELTKSDVHNNIVEDERINESISDAVISEKNNDGSKIEPGEPQVSEKKKSLKRKSSHEKKGVKSPVKKKTQSDVNNSSSNLDVEEIFNIAEKKIEEKLNMKLLKSKKGSKSAKKSKIKNTVVKKKPSKKITLDIPSQSKKQVIDEEMVEHVGEEQDSEKNYNINVLRGILDHGLSSSKKTASIQFRPSEDSDPDKFMKRKLISLDSALPDLIVENENTEENSRNDIVMEAFEDENIAGDFLNEKQDELDKDKPQDIDLNLPGWGSWAGTGINPKMQRKRRRFIVKMPEVMPRRDENKGSLIINEKAASKIKPHLVSEIPFPFKTVKDYEASIRAPIGNTFVPELAFRKFIRPAVETKMGTIIEPATTSILMGQSKK